MAGQFIEKLLLTGSAAINATGNSQANTLEGNAGVNVLDGKGGDDTYVVNTVGDVVLEANGLGNDTVISSVSFSLAGQFIEVLQLTGSAAINGTGNSQVNALFGNDGINTLNGGAGVDTLNGRLGNDILTGGTDTADLFVFNTVLGATNVDTITDFQVNLDIIQLDDAIFTAIGAVLDAGEFVSNINGEATLATQRIVYNAVTGDLFFDVDGLSGVAGVRFAKLAAGLALDHLDFQMF
ncbi:hypothetical protein [Mesorhizobium sp. IMUNJ 23232]|uniref:hypothetical protein n=1 Tax=Mesorhizobium sp. IMUNJ 23232 TaxID=3376064 RepID=UPI003798344A